MIKNKVITDWAKWWEEQSKKSCTVGKTCKLSTVVNEAYELYKDAWKDSHGVTVKQQESLYRAYCERKKDDDRFARVYPTFERFEQTIGYNGAVYATKTEFRHNEFLDEDYIMELLDDLTVQNSDGTEVLLFDVYVNNIKDGQITFNEVKNGVLQKNRYTVKESISYDYDELFAKNPTPKEVEEEEELEAILGL